MRGAGCRGPSKTGKSKGNMRSHRHPERSRKGTNLGVDGTGRQKLEAWKIRDKVVQYASEEMRGKKMAWELRDKIRDTVMKTKKMHQRWETCERDEKYGEQRQVIWGYLLPLKA